MTSALGQGLITNQYKDQYRINISPLVLCTVETEDMLRLVLKRISGDSFFDVEWLQHAFIFQTADNVKTQFDIQWLNCRGGYVDVMALI